MDKAIELLMIEDNPGDIRLNQEYLKQYEVSNHLTVVKNEVEALFFLRGLGQYAHATLPDIILMSIRMLWDDDARLLKQIHGETTLAHIPIVILTAYEGEEEILDKDLPISLCAPKPLTFDCLVSIVKRLENFGLIITKPEPKTKRVAKRGRRSLSMGQINHIFSLPNTLNSPALLQGWENEGGRIEYASI